MGEVVLFPGIDTKFASGAIERDEYIRRAETLGATRYEAECAANDIETRRTRRRRDHQGPVTP